MDALVGAGGEADAAGRLPDMIGDEQGSRRPKDGWQVAALAVEHGGQLADPAGHRPAGLSLGGGHVLEDQIRRPYSVKPRRLIDGLSGNHANLLVSSFGNRTMTGPPGVFR